MKDLDGKAIVITGAGRGIGAACARAAANLGACVVVNDIDADAALATARHINAEGGRAVAEPCDISHFESAAALVARCVEAYGAIHGLVNNAGLFRMGSLEALSPTAFQEVFAVNVAGSAYCAHHAAKVMIAQGEGAIINVTSGAQMGIPLMGIYGASKGAMASFTYAWAMELAPHGIRVNAVSPQGQTRMADITRQYQHDHGLPEYQGKQPSAEQNAPLLCYLLSDRAVGISGQVIRIEGRQLSLVAHPAIALPVLDRDEWTVDSIATAFDETLRQRQLPLGITGVKIEAGELGSTFWSRGRAR